MNKPGAAAVLLLLGSVGLIVVVLTHVAEALHIFPSMGLCQTAQDITSIL